MALELLVRLSSTVAGEQLGGGSERVVGPRRHPKNVTRHCLREDCPGPSQLRSTAERDVLVAGPQNCLRRRIYLSGCGTAEGIPIQVGVAEFLVGACEA